MNKSRRLAARIALFLLVLMLLVLAVASCGWDPTTLLASRKATPLPAASGTAEQVAVHTTALQGVAPGIALTATPGVAGPTSTPPDLKIPFSTVIRTVAAKVRPAVVQITNAVTVMQARQSLTIPAGVGSGVIYDAAGYILTNNHVVEGADVLLVSLPDGRAFTAQLVGRDAETDIAVIKIEGSGLPVADLGDSSEVQIGDWVVAIGNALALPGGPTVTAGIVGAVGRSVPEPSSSNTVGTGPYLFDLIQTDAPINPGNSGGALVDLQGKVVGINTLGGGQTNSGVQAEGIGFAVSIATAKSIADILVKSGQVIHPYVGIDYLPLTPNIAAQLRIQQLDGIVVTTVASSSPAAQAGLQIRDVIIAIDGVELKGEAAYAQIIHHHQPGDQIALTVLRSGETLTLSVTLGTTITS